MGIGGTELNAVRVAERLVRTGVELTVVCFRPDGPLAERYRALGIAVHAIPLRGLARPSTLMAARRLAGLLGRIRPDVFHAHDFYSNAFSVPVARLAGVPRVIASRRWWRSASRVRAAANRWASRAAHLVLANSESVARLVAEEGIPPGRIRVIPNFIEEEAFHAPGTDTGRSLRRELGIPEAAVLCGSVGRLSAEKGHATLLEAFAQIHGEAHLLLSGDGPERGALDRQANRLGMERRLHFAGTRPNRPILAAALDVVIQPSHAEGFPNAVIEAMAVGRPVIATRVGGTPDAVTDGVTGILVSPGDAAGMAAAMAGLIGDAGRRTAMGAAGLERARQQYHERRVIPEWLALYGVVPGTSR
jgi:glycosyltransferase involved in cell wall biosynthesis